MVILYIHNVHVAYYNMYTIYSQKYVIYRMSKSLYVSLSELKIVFCIHIDVSIGLE